MSRHDSALPCLDAKMATQLKPFEYEHMRLSIIIPAYNVDKYIEAALDSVFGQSMVPYEVIVINDGSTDATLDKIEQHSCRSRIQLISTANNGLGPARNAGLKQATGDYVYFFDSDDLLHAEFLTTIHSALIEAGGHDLVLFSGQSFLDERSTTYKTRNLMRPFSATRLSGDEAVAKLVQHGTPIPTAWLYVSKRSLWEQNKLAFKPIIHEDDEIFLKLVLAADRVSVLQTVLMYQRIRSQSIIMSDKTERNADGLLQAAKTLTALYADSKERPRATRFAIRKRAIRTSQRYLRTCHKVGIESNVACIMRHACMLRSTQLFLATLTAIVSDQRNELNDMKSS